MSIYTVELRTLMNDSEVNTLIHKALSTYPMYQSNSTNPEVKAIIPTREELNNKLLNHYKYREIGFETVGRFLDRLETTMLEIMPYYNQMFNTVEIMAELENPFDNVDVVENFKEERSDTTKSTDKINTSSSASDESETTSNVNSNAKNVESDMPQTQISTPAQEIDTIITGSKASWNKTSSNDSASTSGSSSTQANTNNESNGESSGTVEHTFTKKGNQGVNTYAHDMIEFRTSIIDVTMQIINDIRVKELFMQVF